ncbi:hypothetical protein [Actinomadura rudentiformis]|uniref:DUF4175 domain-containing protein n=1 Tax=Actinomadura rudentiformis TaxID=359158 RepID=A0A6H9Y6B6_9ACTN|nr:hypothetical protein [Actinomadura rudentiformis]KAB2339772.1 hypothetical protein F8566_46720 [Actinomadura rudentiformis]
MQKHVNDPLALWVGAVVVLVVVALAAFVIFWLGPNEPEVIAGVLVALGALLGAVPPIIKALRGR